MRVLGNLGWRISWDWNSEWRGGHEANLFPIRPLGDLPLFDFAFRPLSDFAAIKQMPIADALRENWLKVWEEYDAVKCFAGYINAAMCELGFAPDLFICCYRDFGEITAKYGSVAAILPDSLYQARLFPYSALGYHLAVAAHYDIPLVAMCYPRMTEDVEYVIRKLSMLQLDRAAIEEAWSKSQWVRSDKDVMAEQSAEESTSQQ